MDDQIKRKKDEDENVIMKAVKRFIKKDVLLGLTFLVTSNLL